MGIDMAHGNHMLRKKKNKVVRKWTVEAMLDQNI